MAFYESSRLLRQIRWRRAKCSPQEQIMQRQAVTRRSLYRGIIVRFSATKHDAFKFGGIPVGSPSRA